MYSPIRRHIKNITSTSCLSSSLLPSSFIIFYLSSYTRRRLSKALVFHCSSLFLVRSLRPVKIKETVSHHQNNSVKEVGTPSEPSNLCTPLTAISTAALNKVTKTVSRKARVEEQLGSKTVHPVMRDPLHLPALDLSWILSAARQSIRL